MRRCIARLSQLAPLSPADEEMLHQLPGSARSLGRGETLPLPSGEAITFFVLSGFAFRSVITRTGARQIIELFFPGDSLLIEPASESPGFRIEAAEHLAIRAVRTVAIDALAARSPAISLAFAKAKRVQEDALRRRIVCLGRFDAAARIAELLCSVWTRADAAEMIIDGMLHFTLTQADIADITGMTAVHTNRVLQRLRAQKIIRFDTHRLMVLDPIRLAKLCDFPGHPGIERGKWEEPLTGVKAA